MADKPGLIARLFNFKRWRVASKISFNIIGITLILLIVVYSFALVFFSNNLENQMRQNLLLQTNTVATSIDESLTERLANVAELAQRGNAPKIVQLINGMSSQDRKRLYNQSASNKPLSVGGDAQSEALLHQWFRTMNTISESYGYSKSVFCAGNGDIVLASEQIIDFPLPEYDKEIVHGGKYKSDPLPNPGDVKALSTEVLDNVAGTEWFKRTKERKKGSVVDRIAMTVVKDDADGREWSIVISAPISDQASPGVALGYVSFWFPASKLGEPIDLVNKENKQINGSVVYLPYEAKGEEKLYEAMLIYHTIPGITGWSTGSLYYLRPDEYDLEGNIRLQSEFDKGLLEHPNIPWTTYNYKFTENYVLKYLEDVHKIRENEELSEGVKRKDIQELVNRTAFTYDVSGRGIPQLYVNYDVTHSGNAVLVEKDVHMFVYLRINRSTYRAPLNRLIWVSILAFLFIILLLSLFATLIVRRTVSPLVSIRGGIMEVSFGNYDIEIPVETEDEFGDLAKTFNQMITDIKTHIQTETDREQQDNTIAQLLDTMTSASGGDLTVQAEVTADIIGGISDSLNYLISQLKDIIGGVIGVADDIGGSTQETLISTEKLSNEAQEQLELITDTTSAVEEISISTAAASEVAEVAAQSARHSAEIAETGATTVTEAVEGMNQIRGSVAEISKRIKKLGESSQEIGEIVDVISDIAEQTNMLALNAAIEAARAGEQGRGFSVVADAVRQLAERSAKATKDIALLIRGIQAETSETIEVMEESTRLVVEGSRSAEVARQTLEEIVTSSSKLAETISGVADSSRTQLMATQEIDRSMGTISTITKSTTEGTLQVAEALAQVAVLAGQLQELVARFKL
jgi:methyl-accepting chemotaxis protein